jgi:putative ABC transport system substrate-binding protein
MRILSAAAALVLLLTAGDLPAARGGTDDATLLVLLSSGAAPYGEALQGFRETLAVEGEGIRLEVRDLEDDPDAAVMALKEASGRVDMVCAFGSLAAEAVGQEQLSLPVVVGMVPKAREIRRAGKGATGVFLEYPFEIQFRHLRLLLPQARRVGVIYSGNDNEREIPHAADAAARHGIDLFSIRVDGPWGIPGALGSLSRRVDAFWTMQDSLFLDTDNAREMILFSFRNRLPLAGLSPSWVRAGALYSMSWSYRDIGGQCGEMALEVLERGGSGDPPPPVPPRRVHYSVNKRTAVQVKLEIGESVLDGAQAVFRGTEERK